jgi:transposase
VLNPLHVKARHGTRRRGTKTDPVDARLMAEILRRKALPVSPIPALGVPRRRELTRLPADLVAQIRDLKRRINSIVDRTLPEFATCCNDVCGLSARMLLAT